MTATILKYIKVQQGSALCFHPNKGIILNSRCVVFVLKEPFVQSNISGQTLEDDDAEQILWKKNSPPYMFQTQTARCFTGI